MSETDKEHIAIFDSGIGGLTVLYEARKLLPSESFLYYADSHNLPYGPKSSLEIASYVKNAVEYLQQFNLKALVLACNTATSVVVQELRNEYSFPIIGMEPAVKPAAEIADGKKILVCATERTLSEEKLSQLISGLDAEDKVEKMALSELVCFSENEQFEGAKPKNYCKEQFNGINWEEFGALVLGCTHFIFFRNLIQSVIPQHVQVVDGNLGTVKRLASLIETTALDYSRGIVYHESKAMADAGRFERYLKYLQELDQQNHPDRIL